LKSLCHSQQTTCLGDTKKVQIYIYVENPHLHVSYLRTGPSHGSIALVLFVVQTQPPRGLPSPFPALDRECHFLHLIRLSRPRLPSELFIRCVEYVAILVLASATRSYVSKRHGLWLCKWNAVHTVGRARTTRTSL